MEKFFEGYNLPGQQVTFPPTPGGLSPGQGLPQPSKEIFNFPQPNFNTQEEIPTQQTRKNDSVLGKRKRKTTNSFVFNEYEPRTSRANFVDEFEILDNRGNKFILPIEHRKNFYCRVDGERIQSTDGSMVSCVNFKSSEHEASHILPPLSTNFPKGKAKFCICLNHLTRHNRGIREAYLEKRLERLEKKSISDDLLISTLKADLGAEETRRRSVEANYNKLKELYEKKSISFLSDLEKKITWTEQFKKSYYLRDQRKKVFTVIAFELKRSISRDVQKWCNTPTSTKIRTIAKIAKFDRKKELAKRENPLKLMFMVIDNSRDRKESTRETVECLILSLCNTSEKVVHLKKTSELDFSHSINLGMTPEGADLNERMNNKHGLGVSSTTKDEFLRENSEKVVIKLITENIHVFCADNIQKGIGTHLNTNDYKQELFGLWTHCALTETRFPKDFVPTIFDRNMYYDELEDFVYEDAFPKEDESFLWKFIAGQFENDKIVLAIERETIGDAVEKHGRRLVEVKKKCCRRCKRLFGLRSRKCGRCNLELENKSEMEQKSRSIVKEIVQDMNRVLEESQRRIESLQRKKEADICKDEDEEEEEETEGEEEDDDDQDDEFDGRGLFYGDYETDVFPDDEARMRSIDGKDVNPSSFEGVETVVEYFFECSKKNQQNLTPIFSDGIPMDRMNRRIITERKNDEELHWRNVIGSNGIMHTRKKFMINQYCDTDSICPDILASMGWNTEGKLKFIKSCSNLRQSHSTLETISAGLMDEMILKVWSISGVDNLNELDGNFFCNTVKNRLKHEEKSAAFVYEFEGHMLIQYLYKSVREGKVKDVIRACRILTKRIGAKNSKVYDLNMNFEAIERTILPTYIFVLMDVYKVLHNLSKEGYEGHEAKLENLNKWLKMVVGRPTAENWSQASRLLEHLIRIRMNYLSSLNLWRDDNGDRSEITHHVEKFQVRYVIRNNLMENDKIKIIYDKKRLDFSNIYSIFDKCHRSKVSNLVQNMITCTSPSETNISLEFVDQRRDDDLEWEEARADQTALNSEHLVLSIFRGWEKLEFDGYHEGLGGEGDIYLQGKDKKRAEHGYIGCKCGWGFKNHLDVYECDGCSSGHGSSNRVFFQAPICGKICPITVGRGKSAKRVTTGYCDNCLSDFTCTFCNSSVYDTDKEDNTDSVEFCACIDCPAKRPFFHLKCASDNKMVKKDCFFCSKKCCDDTEVL